MYSHTHTHTQTSSQGKKLAGEAWVGDIPKVTQLGVVGTQFNLRPESAIFQLQAALSLPLSLLPSEPFKRLQRSYFYLGENSIIGLDLYVFFPGSRAAGPGCESLP